MNNVKHLYGSTPPNEPVPEVVALAEDMLAQAKAGSLRSMAVVGVRSNNHVMTAWHEEGQYFTVLGGLSWLSQRMVLAGGGGCDHDADEE